MVSLSLLEKYYKDGLLLKQSHPKFDLTIWNYSPKVQFDKLWDDVTIQCRGLVTNSAGEIIARPFKKFFNMEELETIPNDSFTVTDKMDGSLGIVFFYNDDWILATRGSFTSDQAIKGTKLLHGYGTRNLFKNHTYLFEIIYPENRIVVDYGKDEKLVMIGAIETATGIEDDISIYFHYGYDVVEKYNGIKDYATLKQIIDPAKEGYVIRFENGFRMKIKGDEYVRLHKILTNVSNRDIWEYLKNDKPLDEILEKVPDEFYNWVKEVIRDLVMRFDNIKKDYLHYYFDITNKINLDDRKAFAEEAKRYPHPSILFNMKDGKEFKNKIWDIIYPNYSKPFKKNEN